MITLYSSLSENDHPRCPRCRSLVRVIRGSQLCSNPECRVQKMVKVAPETKKVLDGADQEALVEEEKERTFLDLLYRATAEAFTTPEHPVRVNDLLPVRHKRKFSRERKVVWYLYREWLGETLEETAGHFAVHHTMIARGKTQIEIALKKDKELRRVLTSIIDQLRSHRPPSARIYALYKRCGIRK